MKEWLLGLCGYLALNGQGPQACQSVINASYIQTGAKSWIDSEQYYLETSSRTFYETLPGNKPLGAAAAVFYEVRQQDYKLPLYNHVELEYSHYTNYTCNLHWNW